MTPLELAQRMKGLPEAVLDHLYGEEVADLNDSVIRRNAISDLQLRTLFGLLQELFVKEVLPEQLVDEIKKRFGSDDAKARQMALDIAGYRLLPLDKHLGDVDGLIRSLGGDPDSYPKTRVVIERRTPEAAAEDVIRSSAVEATDPLLHDRLKDSIVSYYAGVRTEPQVLESLQRPKKVGGMEYDEATAARVLSAAKEEARSVVIAKEEPRAPAKPAAPVPGPEAVSAKAPETFVTVTEDDEKEIAAIKANVSVPGKSEDTAARIAASVDDLYAASGLMTDDEDRAKRIKTIIGSRLRDVRDSMETLEVLIQPQSLGGLGLSQDDARKLLSVIDAKLRAVHEAHAGEVLKKKETWVGKTQVEAGQVEAATKTAQQIELERLYRSIVTKNQGAAAEAAPQPAPTAAKAAPPPNLPVAGAAPTTLPTTAAPAPVIATLVRPTAPAIGAPVQVRPKMEDVKASPQLTGPVEELRQLTIVDFRRMSKDPNEATSKVKGKIDLLADQSFTKRSQGIAAWSTSEVHKTYLEMMGEALAGTPMKDVIAARQTARKPALTSEEMQALSALSRQLRY